MYRNRSELAKAKLDAETMRAEWLIGITQEILTVPDLVHQSLLDEGVPLRRVTLRQLLLSQPGWGRLRVKRAIDHLKAVTGTNLTERDLTVGWLTDQRFEGRNFLAWIDALHTKDDAPWEGFPFAPAPIGAR